ncbi:MAG: primosomal protein N' [Clostridia bacterium]|nr:primosomal protein N' [Clostridia bacterium]
MSGAVVPGARVVVPFSRSNRSAEGVVLALADESAFDKLKPISSVLDPEPLLSLDQMKLAMWMHERFFCTVYEAVKAMLPVGLWYKNGKQRVGGKTLDMISLAVPAEEALEIAARKSRRAPQQAELLRVLSEIGRVSSKELRDFTGASAQSLKALESAGYIEVETEDVFRRPERADGECLPPPELTEDQQKAFAGLREKADGLSAGAALLFGVTGSGKTTIYIRLIAEMLEKGKSSILLVPEIALTPQMLRTFSSHFGDNIAVMHSSLSMGERYDEWRRIKLGEARVVIGTRSAVFAPARDLGIIIIDEEQEDTYKSENTPRYHARDVAKYRCSQENALLLLGSATPDIESRYYAETGRYGYFALPTRYNEQALPAVEIVDMKRELRRGNGGDISEHLRQELEKNIEAGEQSILFLNRRGANKLIACAECGYTYRCPSCSVSLTYHSYNRKLMCHYCGYTRPPDETCPECGGRLSYTGSGTQKIEEELGTLFPGIGVLRMDTDTVAPAGSHNALLARFQDEKIPILVGTQMVTKGLNFENVTLVGVISADQSLYAGDYRSGERTFSLITQVVGRSGRFVRPGRAVIQTFTPDNQIIRQAADQDYESFYASEIALRRLQGSPPFTELLAVTVSGTDETGVLKCATDVRSALAEGTRGRKDVRILGPAPLKVVKVKNRYRYRVILYSPQGSRLRPLVSDIVKRFSSDNKYRGISLYADNNPLD